MWVPSPILDRSKRNRHTYALGKNWEWEWGSNIKEPNHRDFRSCRTPHTRFTRPLSQKGVARAGVCASAAAAFEYWPLSLGLLISSGFQAPGGSSGCSFQGAVAPVPGQGLQEIACGARQAEVLLGSGPELEELPRSRGPSRAGGQTQRLRSPHLWHLESGPQELPFQLSGSKSDLQRPEGRAQCGGPQGAAGRWKVLGPDFLWATRRTGREGRRLVQGVETLWLLGCQWTWLGRRGREPSGTANPTPL